MVVLVLNPPVIVTYLVQTPHWDSVLLYPPIGTGLNVFCWKFIYNNTPVLPLTHDRISRGANNTNIKNTGMES